MYRGRLHSYQQGEYAVSPDQNEFNPERLTADEDPWWGRAVSLGDGQRAFITIHADVVRFAGPTRNDGPVPLADGEA